MLDRAAGSLRSLSTREAQVLHSLAHGLSNKEIAAALGLSVGTVKTHLRHIFRKLGVSDRTSAAVAVLRGSASS
jgi:DNA-binding NarL/FixJ family response regulator